MSLGSGIWCLLRTIRRCPAKPCLLQSPNAQHLVFLGSRCLLLAGCTDARSGADAGCWIVLALPSLHTLRSPPSLSRTLPGPDFSSFQHQPNRTIDFNRTRGLGKGLECQSSFPLSLLFPPSSLFPRFLFSSLPSTAPDSAFRPRYPRIPSLSFSLRRFASILRQFSAFWTACPFPPVIPTQPSHFFPLNLRRFLSPVGTSAYCICVCRALVSFSNARLSIGHPAVAFPCVSLAQYE